MIGSANARIEPRADRYLIIPRMGITMSSTIANDRISVTSAAIPKIPVTATQAYACFIFFPDASTARKATYTEVINGIPSGTALINAVGLDATR